MTPITFKYGPNPLEEGFAYPARTPGAHLVTLLHGGGLESSTAAHIAQQASTLNQADITVFNIEYAKCSSTLDAFDPYGAGGVEVYEQAKRAIEFAVAHAAEWNADPTRLVPMGCSAGGLLAAMAGSQFPTQAKGVVALSGYYDLKTMFLEMQGGTYASKALALPTFEEQLQDSLGFAFGAATEADLAKAAHWSPVTQPMAPPAFYGLEWERDLIAADQLEGFVSHPAGLGVNVTTRLMPGEGHAQTQSKTNTVSTGWPEMKTALIAWIKAL